MSCSENAARDCGALLIYGSPDLAGILGNDAQIYDFQCGEHVIRFQALSHLHRPQYVECGSGP